MPNSFKRLRNTDGFIRSYLQAWDCPRALTVWLLYESGEHEQLVNLSFDPLAYNSVDAARSSLAATSLLSKANFLKLGVNPKEEALKKFREAEHVCKETNRRIADMAFNCRHTHEVLHLMRKDISKILGHTLDPEQLVDHSGWGPGSTTTVKRREATSPNKFSFPNEMTHDAYAFVYPWFHLAYPNWVLCDLRLTNANKIVTVPKNAKTDRTIAIEPGLNLWFQKGIGKLIRSKLKDVGLDLNTQERNQRQAMRGSKFNTLATIDFSAASDTISSRLVQELLPIKWYAAMDVFRSKYGRLDDKSSYYAKFSSMGNGFTFELESMIFYALARAVCKISGVPRHDITVFGDDVVLPSSCTEVFTEVAKDLGFSVNLKKSFSSSYYRESCGSHYYKGVDIKPYFLKEILNGKATLLKAVNSVRRLAHRSGNSCCDSRLLGCWQYLCGLLGSKTPRISEGFGDCGIICNIDEIPPGQRRVKPKHGWEGTLVRVWLVRPMMEQYYHRGLWLTRLKEVADRNYLAPGMEFDRSTRAELDTSYGNECPLPGHSWLIRKNLLIPRWVDLGPWI